MKPPITAARRAGKAVTTGAAGMKPPITAARRAGKAVTTGADAITL